MVAVNALNHIHAVAQELGDHFERDAVHDHLGGAGVAQRVRGNLL